MVIPIGRSRLRNAYNAAIAITRFRLTEDGNKRITEDGNYRIY